MWALKALGYHVGFLAQRCVGIAGHRQNQLDNAWALVGTNLALLGTVKNKHLLHLGAAVHHQAEMRGSVLCLKSSIVFHILRVRRIEDAGSQDAGAGECSSRPSSAQCVIVRLCVMRLDLTYTCYLSVMNVYQ